MVAAAGLGVGVAACGNDGLTLARQACTKVNASIALYDRSVHDTDPGRAAKERQRATRYLESALPLAAQATSADPQWNPLMTTLQEIGRNSEAHLIAALRAQCTQAARPNEQAPVVPPQPSIATGPATGTTGNSSGGRSSPSTLPGQ